MFGISFWEFILIIVVVLLFLGPERIGPIMRTLGAIMREIQKGVTQMRRELKIDVIGEDVEEIRRRMVRDVAEDEEEAERSSTKHLPPAGAKPPPPLPEKPKWDELHDEDDVEVAVERDDDTGGKRDE
jgi:sec-independent protein translocase protein TatB